MKKMSRRSSCMTMIVLILLVVPFIGWNTLFAMYTDTGRGMLAKSIFEDLLKSNGISLEITDVNNVRNVGNWEQIKDYVSEDINIRNSMPWIVPESCIWAWENSGILKITPPFRETSASIR